MKKKEKTLKERSVGDVSTPVKFRTVREYDSYINNLREEAEALHIKLLDMSCDLSSIKRKMEIAINERNKKASQKAKKVVKEAGDKS